MGMPGPDMAAADPGGAFPGGAKPCRACSDFKQWAKVGPGVATPASEQSKQHSVPPKEPSAPLLIPGRRPGLKDLHQGPVEVELEAGENLEENCQSGGGRGDPAGHGGGR